MPPLPGNLPLQIGKGGVGEKVGLPYTEFASTVDLIEGTVEPVHQCDQTRTEWEISGLPPEFLNDLRLRFDMEKAEATPDSHINVSY